LMFHPMSHALYEGVARTSKKTVARKVYIFATPGRVTRVE
jgi:hypothetical protein